MSWDDMEARFQGRRQNQKSKMKGFDPRRQKPKPWSHQQELADLVGKQIVVTRTDGQVITGKLLAADQFSLKIERPAPVSFVVVYKSALTDFKPGA